jgi:hypothetical protein
VVDKIFTTVISLIGLFLTGCSQRPMDGNDLRGEIEQAQRLARECVLFWDLKDQQHLTGSFARSHADYLKNQAEELEKQIKDKQPRPEIASALNEYREQLDQLSRQTTQLDSSPDKQHFQQLDRDLGELESKF